MQGHLNYDLGPRLQSSAQLKSPDITVLQFVSTSSEQSQGASGGIDIDHPISDALRLNRQTLDETASHEQVDSLMDVQNHD